jgi:putative photosynthetic complex assembly protein 2
MNFLFPISVLVSTAVTVMLVRRYQSSDTAFHGTGYALMSSLLALGVIEHWFMVIPLPSDKLWNWAFKPRAIRAAR